MNETLLASRPVGAPGSRSARRWARRALLFLALAAATLVALVFMLESLSFATPVQLSINGTEVLSDFDLDTQTLPAKLVFAVLAFAALLAAALVVPAVLLLAVFGLVLLALLVVGLPMIVVLVVALLLMSPLLLIGWLLWRALAA
ncbi:MAG TPA: hypothetical protein VIW70_01945 [Rubrivivax sp.]